MTGGSSERAGRLVVDRELSRRTLFDELASLDLSQRREVAKELRTVAETFAGVPDGRHTAHALRLLAHMLDPS